VQDLVVGTGNEDVGSAWQEVRCSQDQIRSCFDAGCLGQDVVVQIEIGGAKQMHHRWQFVHPLPIVALIVVIQSGADPASQNQVFFHFRQCGFGGHDVDIRKRATGGWCQPSGSVGGTLKQQDAGIDLAQRARQMFDFPRDGASLLFGNAEHSRQVTANGGRNLRHQSMLCK
jgi:hypothetical protein